uniref:Mitochondrial fission regulator 2 n=1 Tax=Elaeophora elaphi TaxID=1147741 RepID=A0A0R3RTW5_9BILA
MGDQGSEESVRSSLEDLLKSIMKWPVKEISDLEMDSSGDPDPHNASDLNASFKKLFCESELDMNAESTHQPLNVSTTTAIDKQPVRFNSCNDDFFEMVSRLQSKRLNDQRCDPVILSDLTNHSKNVTRQSDTIACNPETEARFGRRHRLSALFGRVGKAARRQSLLMSASFFPSTTSTPRIALSSGKQQLISDSSDRLHNKSPAICATTSRLQRSASDTVARNAMGGNGDVFVQSGMSQTTESPEFRIPVAPPRNRGRCNQVISSNSISSRQKNGAEGMLDLIASLQGRRMEEQRAHLTVQSEAVSLSINGNVKNNGDNVEQSSPSPPQVEQSRSEDAGRLYEMVIRSQRDRLDEQRSELPRTMPVEDVSQIVMSMQKGRIETQRAELSSASQN